MGFHSVLVIPVTTTTINESAPNRNLDTVQLNWSWLAEEGPYGDMSEKISRSF